MYECSIDGTLGKAKGGGDGIGCTKAGKGVKIMIMVDAKGLPIAVDTCSASPHESKLVQQLFDFMMTNEAAKRKCPVNAAPQLAAAASVVALGPLADRGCELIPVNVSSQFVQQCTRLRPVKASRESVEQSKVSVASFRYARIYQIERYRLRSCPEGSYKPASWVGGVLLLRAAGLYYCTLHVQC